MSKRHKVLFVAVGVMVGAVFVPPSLAYAKEAILEVFVTNTADKPIPVSGNVTVANSSLPVSGTVAVADAREPFEIRVDLSLGTAVPFNNFSFSVPEGKRFVVEFVSASVSLPSGQTPLLSANASNAGLGFPIPLTLQGVGNGNAFFRGATPVLDFAPAGAYLFGLERQNPAGGALSGTASGFVYLSGYLLPA